MKDHISFTTGLYNPKTDPLIYERLMPKEMILSKISDVQKTNTKSPFIELSFSVANSDNRMVLRFGLPAGSNNANMTVTDEYYFVKVINKLSDRNSELLLCSHLDLENELLGKVFKGAIVNNTSVNKGKWEQKQLDMLVPISPTHSLFVLEVQ